MPKRVERLAELITGYCTQVKKGDRVYLITDHPDAQPLYEAVREKVIQKGAFVLDHFVYEDYLAHEFASRSFLRDASEEQLRYLPDIKLKEMKAADVLIWIEAMPASYKFAVKGERISQWSRTLYPVDKEMMKKRYVMTFFPTKNYAKWTGLPLGELRGLYYNACFADRNKLSKKLHHIKRIFDGAEKVRIAGKGTDLTFSLAGRIGAIENGKENLPGGEVYYAPQKTSLEGIITFDFPGVYFGQEMRDIQLEFKRGKIVSAKASKNQETLEAIINTDRGSRFIGEFGIGCNPAVEEWVRELFLAEVMGRTIHFAIGDPYEECGGTHHSAVHFDILKDFRKRGKIWVNGKLIPREEIWSAK